MNTLKSMPSHQEHLLKQERLCFQFSITANATPASKKQVSDIPGLCVLRMQGLTAAADAVETITWTTPVDNSGGNSVFGILLNLDRNLADKVYSVSVSEVTALATSIAVTGPNNTAGAYLTAAGNIAIEVAGTGLNLASESPTFKVTVEYREARP